MLWRKVFLTLLVAGGFLLQEGATYAAPAGTVIASQGQCFSVSGGQRLPLRIGTAIGVGDMVQVPAGAKLKLRMSDGSVISVASGSELSIQDYTVDASGQRLNALLSLNSGLVRALVANGAPRK